jgi:eukaryotic-like serine/threonine-protein kinase
MSATPAVTLINGRYRLLDEIGRGGMGVVFRAYDRLTGQIVALKRLTLDTMEGSFAGSTLVYDDLRALLTREFVALARLRHPNIVSVLDFGFTPESQPFLVMEYVAPAQTLNPLRTVGQAV